MTLWADLLASGVKPHTKKQCKATWWEGGPKACVVHRPSDHFMREWPLVCRTSRLLERVCAHGVGHPDPDSLAYFLWRDPETELGFHGCDGCCTPGACPVCSLDH